MILTVFKNFEGQMIIHGIFNNSYLFFFEAFQVLKVIYESRSDFKRKSICIYMSNEALVC